LLAKIFAYFQVFETNRAVSLAKAVFERKDEDQQQQQQQLEEARKKYERDILSRPSVFSKLNERIKSLDLPDEGAAPAPTPVVKEPAVEEPIRAEKVVPCAAAMSRLPPPPPPPWPPPTPL